MLEKLSIKIILVVSVVLFLIMSLTLAYIVTVDRNTLFTKTSSDAASINRRIYDSLIAVMALGSADPDAIHNLIKELAASEEKDKESDILGIRLIHRPDIAKTFRDEKIAQQYRPQPSESAQDISEKNALAGYPFKGEIKVAKKGRQLRAIKYITPVKTETRCLLCHTAKEDETIAAISSVVSLEDGYSLIEKKAVRYLLLFILAFVFALLILYFFMHKIVVGPILALHQAAWAIAKYENLSVEVEVKSKDEIGDLGRAFNEMTKELRVSRDEISSAKELTETIAEGVEEGVMLLSRDFKILWANKKIIQMSGLKKDEMINKTCYEVTHHIAHPCRPPLDLCPIDEVLTTGKSKNIEHKHSDKDGNEFIVEVIVHPIKDEEGNIQRFIHISRDITVKRMLEAELMQTEKMSALGVLSTGVAHEIKNPLAIISQGLDYLSKVGVLQEAKPIEVLSMTRDAVRRAETIIRDLLFFARKSALEIKPDKINEVLDFSLELVKNNPDFRNVKLVKEYQDGLPDVLVDKNRIAQVFLNIILNAAQAMSGEGSLIVRTRVKELSEVGSGVGRRAEDFFQLGERVVFVEIEDSGPGIAEEKIGKLFTPFFTTKGPGKGVGLGLSVSKTIIESHKGLIRVESPQGKGAKFVVILPVAKK